MFNVRRSLFETNSSSMHSIVISEVQPKHKQRDYDLDIKDGVLDLRYILSDWGDRNHFDRSPFEVLNTPSGKLRYLIASMYGNNYTYKSYRDSAERFDEELIPILKSVFDVNEVRYELDGIDHFYFHMDENGDAIDDNDLSYSDYCDGEVDDKTGLFKTDNNGAPIGYFDCDVPAFGSVDHQSAHVLPKFLQTHSIEEYLTNDSIFVVIDGDEYCEFDKLIDLGVVKNIKERCK